MTMLVIAAQFFDEVREPSAEVQNFTLVANTWTWRNSSGFHPASVAQPSSLTPQQFIIGGTTYNITAWVLRDAPTFAHEDLIIAFNTSTQAAAFVAADLYVQDGLQTRTFRTGGADRNGSEVQWRFSDLTKYVSGRSYSPRISTAAF